MTKADFRCPDEPVLYDTTAGACAVCGLLELARNLPKYEGQIYYNVAIKMFCAMEESFCNYNPDTDAILEMVQNGGQMTPKSLPSALIFR